MNILFVMRHGTYLRNYGSTIRMLAARGHLVHVGFNRTKQSLAGDLDAHVKRLSEECPAVQFQRLAARGDYWTALANQLRMFRHYLRYLHPRYRNATGLVERAEERVCLAGRLVKYLPVVRGPLGTAVLSWVLGQLERAVPSDPAIEAAFRSFRPDVVVVTPLVDFEPDQVDYLKSAKWLGLPSALGVASWDNLTNKGLILIEPDLVIVWNEAQRREAVELHGIAPEKTAVTGAQLFDHWFEQRPQTNRAEFGRRVGLDPARPLLLYLCSSFGIAPREAEFVDRWLGHLRARPEPLLRQASVLIRPHPANVQQWKNVDFSHHGEVAIWPRGGVFPVGPAAQADYFDSLYHSAAVLGINTSALIEAGVVGRRCFTILAPEFTDSQEGTLHFSHLKEAGFLVRADSFEAHFAQLRDELEGKTDSPERIRDFLASFVRPHGLETPATPRVVEAIEQLARAPAPRPERTPPWLLPLRWALAPAALLARRLWRAVKKKNSARPAPAAPKKKKPARARPTTGAGVG